MSIETRQCFDGRLSLSVVVSNVPYLLVNSNLLSDLSLRTRFAFLKGLHAALLVTVW